ncbi:hypothetical protein [Pseudomonas aeruginosa]|uniref:hypothetical protein n=1 Tax=Pseudomonas aeruginosa TaxID=287 RepID=UPI0034D37621
MEPLNLTALFVDGEDGQRLAEDAEVQRLRGLFERIQKATADGVLPLPGEQHEAIPA